MKNFKDFGIKSESQGFTGDKIKIMKIINKEITVHAYKIEDSKYSGGKCLHMQISIGDTKHVVFIGSKRLMEVIERVPKDGFPFITTITKDNERYEFT